eukprot:1301821-Pleurochrysis_carterae.AAC.4
MAAESRGGAGDAAHNGDLLRHDALRPCVQRFREDHRAYPEPLRHPALWQAHRPAGDTLDTLSLSHFTARFKRICVATCGGHSLVGGCRSCGGCSRCWRWRRCPTTRAVSRRSSSPPTATCARSNE